MTLVKSVLLPDRSQQILKRSNFLKDTGLLKAEIIENAFSNLVLDRFHLGEIPRWLAWLYCIKFCICLWLGLYQEWKSENDSFNPEPVAYGNIEISVWNDEFVDWDEWLITKSWLVWAYTVQSNGSY